MIWGSAWPLVLGWVSAESVIGIQSGPGGMWWEMEMLLGLFWVSRVDLVGIGPGAGGRWIPGSSEKPSCPTKQKSTYFLYFYLEHNVNIVFYNILALIFLFSIYFCNYCIYCIFRWRAP